jgi:magnesium transporter
LDENEMPRVERDGKNTYIFTRFAITDRELRITTSPLLFVLANGTLLTFSPERFSRMNRFTSENKIEFNTSKHIEMMLRIFDQIDDDYEAKLNGISRQIKTIRSRLRVEEIRNKDFIDFVTIEDVLNEFLSALSPTNSILRRLLLGRHVQLDSDDKDLVEDLLLNNEQSIVGCKSSLKTIVNIREAYSTIMANNLNQVIRLLTVLTLIISLPTLLASMYGMNINLPLADSPFAFAIIIICSILFSMILLAFFRSRKWF